MQKLGAITIHQTQKKTYVGCVQDKDHADLDGKISFGSRPLLEKFRDVQAKAKCAMPLAAGARADQVAS